MGFKVGEKIVYPNHGVSVVEKIGEGFATEPVAPRSFYHLRLLPTTPGSWFPSATRT